MVRQLPQRTIAEFRAPPPADDPEVSREDATVDLSDFDLVLEESDESQEGGDASSDGDAARTIDDDSLATMEFAGDSVTGDPIADDSAVDAPQQPPTVTFKAEQTVEFLGGASGSGGASDPDATMLTSQWQSNIAGSPTDSRATIKQKETITGSFMSSSSLVVKSRHVRPTGATASPIMSPADAPDYELLNVIGEGGMGVVYAARQSSIARTVAVKMLKGDDANSAAQRDKFISEAVVTGELDHPNIVPIYDLGANDQGALFYSMKRVKGTPWNKVLKEKSLDENLTILLRMADAVAFAHVNGVIHRDLKPENVMLGDFGEVLVMDWGLARVSPEFPNAASVSQSDAMGGTPAYMAPEMATGPLEKITTASDVYLLGAILYEIITGRPPHSGKTVMACLFAAAKNQIVAAEQGGELMDVALKAMATDATQRHASVPEFQRAIRRYQSHSESIKLTESAERNLVKAAETKDYDVYARALYGLEESLALWSGNKRAAELLSRARLEYARLALSKGDYDLGASLLDPAVEGHGEVLAQLNAGRRERESRKRWVKLLKGAVAALLIAVGGIVSVAYVKVSQQRDRAVKAEGEATANAAAEKLARQDEAEQRLLAEKNEEKAKAQEKIANENADEAKRQATIAEENAIEAGRQEQIAKAEAAAAEKAREEETKAKERQEYEAYVAQIGLAKSKIDENAFDRATELLEQCKPALRDWEWGRLSYLCQLAEKTWQAPAPLDTAAFSPDSVHFATGDWDGDATIWNRQTGERERQLSQGQYVHSVAYDATGDRLAAGSSDGSVIVYRAADGQVLADLPGHTGAVLSVRFSPDGSKLLTCSRDQTARLWDLATNELLQTLHGHSWWVWSAEFSPTGEDLVTAGQDGKAIVWRRGYRDVEDTAEGQDAQPASPDEFGKLTEFTSHQGPVYAAKFSPDGKLVATAGADHRVLLWDPAKVQPIDVNRRLEGKPDLPVDFREFAGRRAPVKTVAFSPDGKSLAAGGEDNVVIIWDVATGELRHSLRGHASAVASCEFSRDGEELLTAGRDKLIKLWRPATYAETRSLGSGANADAEAVLDARFSPDGSSIVTAGRDRTASLWDAATLDRLQSFQEGHEFLVTSAVFFDGGARVATGAGDGSVRVWDVATGAEVVHLDGTGRTAALDVSDDGALLATGSADNSVQIWDADTGEKLAVLSGHRSEVTALRFAPGGRLLASGGERGHCRLWRRGDDGQWTGGAALDGHSRAITAMAFVDDGARLITASGDNTCGQWDVAAGRELRDRVLKHPNWITDMVVSRDGQLALTSCDDGIVRLWSLNDGQVLRTMRPYSDKTAFTSIDMTADGRLAAAACAADGSIRLWDLTTGEEVTTADDAGKPRPWLDLSQRGGLVWAARFAPEGERLLAIGGNDAQLFDVGSRKLAVRFSPHGAVASASVSPDGTRVVTGSWDRSAKIWDAATGLVIAKLDGQHEGYINSAVFSPDGARVLTASDDGTARLWDAADGRPLDVVFRGHKDRVREARFSPDGTRVLTVSNDKTAIVWDAATGEPLLTLSGHEWGLRSGAFSADGRRIITGSDDNTAIVWDAATGERIGDELRGHTGGVTSVALSADGDRALTGSEDTAVKLWDADTAKEILTLSGHKDEVTAVSFSPDGRQALTSGRDGLTLLWPSVPWEEAPAQQAIR
jgi:WD40 repeat protein/serine/threonine protein kinase